MSTKQKHTRGPLSEYHIAFSMESGEWDIVESFYVPSDAAANAYAERNYSEQEWYVLDKHGANING